MMGFIPGWQIDTTLDGTEAVPINNGGAVHGRVLFCRAANQRHDLDHKFVRSTVGVSKLPLIKYPSTMVSV